MDDIALLYFFFGMALVFVVILGAVILFNNQHQEMLQLCLDYGYSAYHDGACYSNTIELGR